MMHSRKVKALGLTIAAVVALAMAPAAWSYVGPGAGLGVLGAIVAVIAALLASVVGLVLWPIRKFMRRRKGAATTANEGTETPRS